MLRCVVAFLTVALCAAPAAAGDIFILVDISEQRMWVAVDGVASHTFDVSTGRKGYETPAGQYGVTRMYRKYHSKKYDGAPMPFSIFFHEGYAIHGTTDLKRLGKIASHGCVRLHPDHAELLFDLVASEGDENVKVHVMS